MPADEVPPVAPPTHKQYTGSAVVSQTAQNPMSDWLKGNLPAFATFVKLAGAAGLTALMLNFLVDPFQNRKDIAPIDNSEQWTKSISKYGITPLYPPSEDMLVGDIFVQAIDEGLPDDVTRNDLVKPLFLKRVRIGHLDLPLDNVGQRRGVAFTPTVQCTYSADGKRLCPDINAITYVIGAKNTGDSTEAAVLVGFPELTEEVTGSALVDLSSLALPKMGKTSARKMRLGLNNTAMLSTSSAKALSGLINWCLSDSEGKVLCKGAVARKLIASTFGGAIYLSRNTKTAAPAVQTLAAIPGDQSNCAIKVMITVITRTYLSREIRAAWENDENRTASQQASTGSTENQSQSFATSGSNDVLFDSRFDRPIVFGYESVKMTLGEESSVGGVDRSCG
jgi:hypothetical protein